MKHKPVLINNREIFPPIYTVTGTLTNVQRLMSKTHFGYVTLSRNRLYSIQSGDLLRALIDLFDRDGERKITLLYQVFERATGADYILVAFQLNDEE